MYLLNLLAQFFRGWDWFLDCILGSSSEGWRFGPVATPTELDALSFTTALLWVCRNVESEVVLAGFVTSLVGLGVGILVVLGVVLRRCQRIWLGFPQGSEKPPQLDSRGTDAATWRTRTALTCPPQRLAIAEREVEEMFQESGSAMYVEALHQVLRAIREDRGFASTATPRWGSREVSTVEETE